jgi:hypothetical protein
LYRDEGEIRYDSCEGSRMFELAFIVGINIYLEGGRNKIHKITCEGVFEFELSIVSMYHLYPPFLSFLVRECFRMPAGKEAGRRKPKKSNGGFGMIHPTYYHTYLL